MVGGIDMEVGLEQSRAGQGEQENRWDSFSMRLVPDFPSSPALPRRFDVLPYSRKELTCPIPWPARRGPSQCGPSQHCDGTHEL